MAKYSETFRRVMEGDYKDASIEEKTEAVREVIQVASIAAGAIAVQPFPFVDSALIAPIQIGMVQAIGRIHGYRLDKKSVIEILSTLGASIVAQNVMMAASKLVPFVGWVVSISMAYALTYAIGEVSDFYFKSGRGVAPDELKEMFEKVYKEKRAEKESKNKGNETLKDKLEQLKEAYKNDLLTEAEFNKKKEELLASF